MFVSPISLLGSFIISVTIVCFLKIPDLKDPDTMQKFFLQEIQIGEELLANGKRVDYFVHG